MPKKSNIKPTKNENTDDNDFLDWGVARCKRRKAENLLANEELAIRQETMDLERKLSDLVGQFNIQNHRLQLAVRTAELSQKRYEITAESYALGKIGFLDFSTAQYEKDNARITYIQALSSSWQSYYQIRKMTLFDFEKEVKVTRELPEAPK